MWKGGVRPCGRRGEVIGRRRESGRRRLGAEGAAERGEERIVVALLDLRGGVRERVPGRLELPGEQRQDEREGEERPPHGCSCQTRSRRATFQSPPARSRRRYSPKERFGSLGLSVAT